MSAKWTTMTKSDMRAAGTLAIAWLAEVSLSPFSLAEVEPVMVLRMIREEQDEAGPSWVCASPV